MSMTDKQITDWLLLEAQRRSLDSSERAWLTEYFYRFSTSRPELGSRARNEKGSMAPILLLYCLPVLATIAMLCLPTVFP